MGHPAGGSLPEEPVERDAVAPAEFLGGPLAVTAHHALPRGGGLGGGGGQRERDDGSQGEGDDGTAATSRTDNTCDVHTGNNGVHRTPTRAGRRRGRGRGQGGRPQRRTLGIPSPIQEMISRWISLLPPPKVKMTALR
ncbi:hypothetical protein GCM10010214_19630 [Streptomyces abikoensis]|nr:hypothetical protein GCM10010214_19630 [Streptomyces abikoensis]